MSENAGYIKLIQSTEWRRLRSRKIKDNPVCEECEIKGITTPAQEVHHIKPIESGRNMSHMEALAYDYSNLMSVCRACHKDIHIEMQRNRNCKQRRAENAALKISDFTKRYF